MSEASSYQHIFGPVMSRRLGVSLGIDLVPLKTCSYNCIYCQLGRTADVTVCRREYVSVEAVHREIEAWLRAGGTADTMTLAGSGEPTLHSRFGQVLHDIRNLTAKPVALLSNGSLFHLPEVREQARAADIVKVTLSTWDQSSFDRLHRAHRSLSYADIWNGQRIFRKEYSGRLWVEVFIVPGINDSPEAVKRIAQRVAALEPDRIQMNTAVRAAAETEVESVPQDCLRKLAGYFTPPADIPEMKRAADTGKIPPLPELVSRHPMTAEQIAALFDADSASIARDLEAAVKEGYLECVVRGEQRFYRRRHE